MNMQINETGQGKGAVSIYPPVAGLAAGFRFKPQTINRAVAQD